MPLSTAAFALATEVLVVWPGTHLEVPGSS